MAWGSVEKSIGTALPLPLLGAKALHLFANKTTAACKGCSEGQTL
jgi:hypothetical protein